MLRILIAIVALIVITFTAASCSAGIQGVKQEKTSQPKDRLEISRKAFQKKVKVYSGLMFEKKVIDIDTMVDICRVFNTINFEEFGSTESLYIDFIQLFWDDYLEEAVKLLEASLSRGMGYYSKKYNMDIGGTPRASSMYKIIE